MTGAGLKDSDINICFEKVEQTVFCCHQSLYWLVIKVHFILLGMQEPVFTVLST